jgi:hypothetical protein
MTGGGALPPTDTPTPTWGLRPSVAHPASIKAPSPVSSSVFFISPPDRRELVSSRFPEPWRRLSLGGTGWHTSGSVEQAQCLFLPPRTAEMTERFYVRNVLIIQSVPCLNLSSPRQAILPRSSCWLGPKQFFVFFRQIWTQSRSNRTGAHLGVSSKILSPIDGGS